MACSLEVRNPVHGLIAGMDIFADGRIDILPALEVLTVAVARNGKVLSDAVETYQFQSLVAGKAPAAAGFVHKPAHCAHTLRTLVEVKHLAVQIAPVLG